MTSTSNSDPRYLIAYGTAGLLGWFVSEDPVVGYQRGALVRVSTERGCEKGKVLMLSELGTLIDPSIHQGVVLGLTVDAEESPSIDSTELTHRLFLEARQIVHDWKLAANVIDVELTENPATAVCHVLRFNEIDLSAWQAELAQRWQRRVLLQDLTNPSALEEAESGCSSCGSGSGCGDGGCSSGGSCSRTKSPSSFHTDWQKYFAERRANMVRHIREDQAD